MQLWVLINRLKSDKRSEAKLKTRCYSDTTLSLSMLFDKSRIAFMFFETKQVYSFYLFRRNAHSFFNAFK